MGFYMTVLVQRLVTVAACATTLSLFAVICTIASVEVSRLRWDGSFCTHDGCKVTALAQARSKPVFASNARAL